MYIPSGTRASRQEAVGVKNRIVIEIQKFPEKRNKKRKEDENFFRIAGKLLNANQFGCKKRLQDVL